MGIAEDIKNLGEDIIASYDSRVKEIGTLVNDVHKKLKGFENDRKKMSAEQKKALSGFVRDLNKNVDTMIKEFNDAHNNISVELKKDLTNYVLDIKVNVENKLKEFSDAHAEMGEELRKELAKGETDRLTSFKSMMEEIQKRIEENQKSVKEIEPYVNNKLKEFHNSHTDMSEKLKKNLADYVEGIVSETRNLLTGFETERKRMATNWQNMAAAMAERRGVKAEVKEEIKVKPIKESVEKKVSSGNDLENKVLKFIEKHPKGVKISDMERLFGVPRVRLGQISNRLLNDGKVRKEEKLYFPL